MRNPDTCPHCQSSLKGAPIPERFRECYGDVTHWSRAISIVDQDADRVFEVQCPDCKNAIWREGQSPRPKQTHAIKGATMHLEDPNVTDLGCRIGFGRVMQAAEAAWSRIAEEEGVPGSNHTVGPCAALLVTCPHREEGGREKWLKDSSHCDWCCGAGRVTERVAQAMRECKS